MRDFINKIYKNHSLIYKVLLFIATTFLIVYLFPKSGKFKYSFEKGKPWQSENLYAPFDFAIKKSEEELQVERETIENDASPYFNVSVDTVENVKANYEDQFSVKFNDSIISVRTNRRSLYNGGLQILDEIYKRGVLDEQYNYEPDKLVVLLENRNQVGTVNYSSFLKTGEFRSYLEGLIQEKGLSSYNSQYLSLFFDIIKPNISLNSNITQSALEEELNKISQVRGQVARETLIISKGEVVEGDKFKILESLQSEYESEVWSEANYNWILAAYTLLVALALLMLLLFLRKYRIEVYENNTNS